MLKKTIKIGSLVKINQYSENHPLLYLTICSSPIFAIILNVKYKPFRYFSFLPKEKKFVYVFNEDILKKEKEF